MCARVKEQRVTDKAGDELLEGGISGEICGEQVSAVERVDGGV